MHAADPTRPSVRIVRMLLWAFAALALVYLISEHPKHLLGWLPAFAIMACPLMHLLMHRGHHHPHDGKNGISTIDPSNQNRSTSP